MFRPAPVVAIWTAANIVLASLMWIFGEKWIFIGLYYVAALPLFLGAALVRVSVRRRPEPPTEYRIGQRSGMLLPLTAGITMFGIGLVYQLWLCLPALAVMVLSGIGMRHRAAPEETR